MNLLKINTAHSGKVLSCIEYSGEKEIKAISHFKSLVSIEFSASFAAA